jgi:hypothetical protein
MRKLFLILIAAATLVACQSKIEEIIKEVVVDNVIDQTVYATGIELVDENGAAIADNRVSVTATSDFTFAWRLIPAGAVLPEEVEVKWISSVPDKIAITPNADGTAATVTAADGAVEGDFSLVVVSFGEGDDEKFSTAVRVTMSAYATGIALFNRDGENIVDNAVMLNLANPAYTFSYGLIPEGSILPEGAHVTWSFGDDDPATTLVDTNFSIARTGNEATVTYKSDATYNATTSLTVSFGDGAEKIVSPAIALTARPWDTATEISGIPDVTVDMGEPFSLDLSNLVVKIGSTVVTDPELKGVKLLPQGTTLSQNGTKNSFIGKSAGTAKILVLATNHAETIMDDAMWEGEGKPMIGAMMVNVTVNSAVINPIVTYYNTFGSPTVSILDAITGDPGVDKSDATVVTATAGNVTFTGGFGFSKDKSVADLTTSNDWGTDASAGYFITDNSTEAGTLTFNKIPLNPFRNIYTLSFAVKWENTEIKMNSDSSDWGASRNLVLKMQGWGSEWGWNDVSVQAVHITAAENGWYFVNIPGLMYNPSWYTANDGCLNFQLEKKAATSANRLYVDDFKLVGTGL